MSLPISSMQSFTGTLLRRYSSWLQLFTIYRAGHSRMYPSSGTAIFFTPFMNHLYWWVDAYQESMNRKRCETLAKYLPCVNDPFFFFRFNMYIQPLRVSNTVLQTFRSKSNGDDSWNRSVSQWILLDTFLLYVPNLFFCSELMSCIG